MATNTSQTLWVSNSKIGDFLGCPRLYYLRHIYRDPQTYHKLSIVKPSLTLGNIIHATLSELGLISAELRLQDSLISRYERLWEGVTGIRGGFNNKDEENEFKERGVKMIQRIIHNPGPISRKAIKVSSLTKEVVLSDDLPNYWFDKNEQLILCGKIDWIEYLPEDNSIHIIDFKTGKNEEDDHSLQLPIYYLLATNCQKRKVRKASYWYLNNGDELSEMPLPDLDDSYKNILQIALMIKEAISTKSLCCKTGGCFKCEPYERILKGEGKFVGISGGYQDVYVLG